jgi:hypothetical protein
MPADIPEEVHDVAYDRFHLGMGVYGPNTAVKMAARRERSRR